MRKYVYVLILFITICSLGALKLVNAVFYVPLEVEKETTLVIEKFKEKRRVAIIDSEEALDPFMDNDIVKVLLIGLDTRAGETIGHCDAIQLITIDREKESVSITAVPRGTYSPLPKGKVYSLTDYYVSNACGVGGLEYGVEQIEQILGEKADYLVVVGFSEALGILRNLKLPTTSTLQWLRQRQSHVAGEPQRAHDHSTFLKYLLINYLPLQSTGSDKIWQYIMYKSVSTNLSFSETQNLVKVLSDIDFSNNQNQIKLAMRPDFKVSDINYSPENIDEYLVTSMDNVKKYLSVDDFSGTSIEEVQVKLIKLIDDKKNDPVFITWVFENNLWLQIEDEDKRLEVQFEFLKKYTRDIFDRKKRERLIDDYILEMEQCNKDECVKKGEALLIQ